MNIHKYSNCNFSIQQVSGNLGQTIKKKILKTTIKYLCVCKSLKQKKN